MAASTLAFVGGTGKLGRGLGLRLAAAGHAVMLGSRAEGRAREAAAVLRRRLAAAHGAEGKIEGVDNAVAAARADVIFLTLPFEALDGFLAAHGALLAGKVVVDVVNPLRVTDGRFTLAPVPDGSVGQQVQRLARRARVVSAFKNASAAHLLRLDQPAAGDVFIACDDREAGALVHGFARAIPNLRPLDAGPLANSAFLESLTALELNLNRIHGTLTSIRVLGID